MNELTQLIVEMTFLTNARYEGTTADVHFFHVALSDSPTSMLPSKVDRLRELIGGNQAGVFTDLDLFDGHEHNYLMVGGWIGDQGMALRLMGLGSLLGFWTLLTPEAMGIDKENATKLADLGMVSIISRTNA